MNIRSTAKVEWTTTRVYLQLLLSIKHSCNWEHVGFKSDNVYGCTKISDFPVDVEEFVVFAIDKMFIDKQHDDIMKIISQRYFSDMENRTAEWNGLQLPTRMDKMMSVRREWFNGRTGLGPLAPVFRGQPVSSSSGPSPFASHAAALSAASYVTPPGQGAADMSDASTPSTGPVFHLLLSVSLIL